MNIPETVRIHGIDYSITKENIITSDGKELYGEIRYDKASIGLSKSACQDKQIMEVTLIHEILHGIRQASGMEIGDEEEIVDMFARGIYQVIKDNASLFEIRNS